VFDPPPPTPPPATAAAQDAHDLGYNGWTDDGCVVIRHDTEIGANAAGVGTQVRYFSIYMHLNTLLPAVRQNQPIQRKAEIGTAGMFEGEANVIHFEIICDDANLQALIGRNTGQVNANADGRTDAVFGEMYFRLPATTQVYAARPPLHQTAGTGGANLGEELFVGVLYGLGNAQVRTYRADGTEVGTHLPGAGSEYTLYTHAGQVVQAYRTAQSVLPQAQRAAFNVPAHSAVYELLRFGRVINTGNETLTPADTPHWREIPTPAGQGWVNLNGTDVFKFNDADAPHWAGWDLVQDYQDNDSRCDVATLRHLLDTNGDGITTQAEAQARLAQPAVQRQLKRLICKFPTEWHRGSIPTRWQWLTREGPNGPPNPNSLATNTYLTAATFPEFQRYAEALAFWEAANLGIPESHWHFDPREFIALFRKCGWLSSNELQRALSAAPVQGRRRADSIRIPSIKILTKYMIGTSRIRTAHFLAQVGHETGWWQFREEQGGPRYFRTMYEIITPQEAAEDYRSGLAQRLGLVRRGETEQQYAARRPGAVLAKAATLDNGAANAAAGGQVGDGSRFRGRGFLQITGRRNYASYGVYRGQNFTTDPNPELLATDDYNACDASGFYWARESINREADQGSAQNNVTRVGGVVNRGRADRIPIHNNERWIAFSSIWRYLNDEP